LGRWQAADEKAARNFQLIESTTTKYIRDGESTRDDVWLAALVGLSLWLRSCPERPRAATRTRINKKEEHRKRRKGLRALVVEEELRVAHEQWRRWWWAS
jgi:hypothetical protein